MFVITRRPGESFFIGDDIEVAVLEAGSQVRVGVYASPEFQVMRRNSFLQMNSRPYRSGEFEHAATAPAFVGTDYAA
jgi:carbon storage regulator CsrA